MPWVLRKFKAATIAPNACARTFHIGYVMSDIRMGRIEFSCRRIDVVTAFRYRQCNDSSCLICHAADEGRIVIFDRQIVDHRSDHFCRHARRCQLNQGRQTILLQEFFSLNRIVRTHTGPDHCPVMVKSKFEELLQVPGLMRTLEIAEPDVDNSRRQGRPVIRWTLDRLRQVAQNGIRQANHRRTVGRSTVFSLSIARKTVQAIRSP